ncbi:hypothetical protein ACJX0J_010690, partial [Zea mays]
AVFFFFCGAKRDESVRSTNVVVLCVAANPAIVCLLPLYRIIHQSNIIFVRYHYSYLIILASHGYTV